MQKQADSGPFTRVAPVQGAFFYFNFFGGHDMFIKFIEIMVKRRKNKRNIDITTKNSEKSEKISKNMGYLG